ncbi:MAG: glycosyltransferase family 39 protein [Ignavibacterium sp.]|nr:glycosyltransferase family 39 protein [Ignavibacterium sp.]
MDQRFISGILNKILTIILCALPVVLASFLYPDFLGDDTYIHIGFILGLLNGEGFAFTGSVTYGSTSPMWVFMGAFISIITDNPEFSVRLLSGIFSVISVFLFLIIADILKLRSSIKFIAALSFCLNPFFLRWAISGMEATASIAILLFLVYTYYDRYHVRHPYIYGLLLGFAFLIRPEFIVYFFIFILFMFFVNTHHRKQTFKTLLSGISLFSAWFLFAYLHFGTIIPNTYRAKAPGGFFTMTFEGTIRNIKLLLGGNIPEFILLSIIILITIILLLKKDQKFIEEFVRLLDRLRHTGLMLAIMFFVSFYVYYTVKDVTIISRYSLMFVPVIILFVAALINLLTNYKSQFNLSLVAIYSVLVLLIHIHITFSVVKPASDLFVKGFQNSYKEIANFIKMDENDDFKTVALNDVGIVGCYSGAKVYDLAGLVDADRFNYENVSDYVKAKNPHYLVLREDVKLTDAIDSNIRTEIIYQKEIPGFGINSLENRTVTLYRLYWNE